MNFYDEFGFYRSIRRGKTGLPRRTDVMHIATSLKCMLPERNKLLIAAECTPVEDYIEGLQLVDALKTARIILDYLPFPAIVITRDDTIHAWNHFCTVLFNIPHEVLEKIPIEQRNVLRFIFDPHTPVYDLITNQRRDFRWQRYTAKRDNVLCQHDKWYQRRRASLEGLPEFDNIWRDIQLDTGIEEITKEIPSGLVTPEYVTYIYTIDGRKFRVRGLQIDYTGWGFPKIIAYVFDDEAARHIYEELGLPTPGKIWEHFGRSDG
jgi:MmyB-like transcription regulator ligand binding domain